MILSDMRDLLRKRLGNVTAGDASDTELDRLLNDAMREIMDKYPFHSSRSVTTFPTVIGSKRYTVPTDMASLLKVWNATSRMRVRKADMRFMSQTEDQDTTVTGKPLKYTRELDWIQFYPIPDAVYTISLFYKNTIADLVGDGAIPLIPEAWHKGIILLARYTFYDERQDAGKAGYALNAYKIWLSDKPSEIAEESIDKDEAVEVPTLSRHHRPCLDFDHRD